MVRRDEQGDKARRAKMRDQLAAQGLDHPDDIAAQFMRQWPTLTPIGAYRLVEEMSQPVVADRYNTLTGRQPFESGWLTRREVSRLELWPHHGDARQPSAGELTVLAQVFGASSPIRLVDPGSWAQLDPSDQAALRQQQKGDTQIPGARTDPVTSVTPTAGDWSRAGVRPQAQPPAAQGTRVAGTDNVAGPPSVERLVAMAAEESANYADRPSNVGPFTMEQFRADATRLARSFPNAPRLDLFTELRWQRDRVFGALEGRQPVEQSRDLYFLAGAVCGMLAEITEDLGYRDAAMTHTRTGWLCAKEADHHGLMAWILREQAQIAYYGGRAQQATDYAAQAQEFGVQGTVTVWLPMEEARARARLGDGDGVNAALDRAERARGRARTGELDEIGGIFGYSEAKQNFYAGAALVALGDGGRAEPMSRAAVAAYEAGPPEDRAADNIASAHLDIAMARVLGGDLDGAAEAATEAFEIPARLRLDSHSLLARRLLDAVATSQYRGSPTANTLRQRTEHFLATAGPALST